MIYFVQQISTGYIKIGVTRDIPTRMKVLKTKYGVIELMGICEGYHTEEKKIHKIFNDYQIKDKKYGEEWFQGADTILDYVSLHTRKPTSDELKSQTRSIQVTVTEELSDQLFGIAQRNRVTASSLIREALEQYIARDKRNRAKSSTTQE